MSNSTPISTRSQWDNLPDVLRPMEFRENWGLSKLVAERVHEETFAPLATENCVRLPEWGRKPRTIRTTKAEM